MRKKKVSLNDTINTINRNNILYAFIMIFLSVGSKYTDFGFTHVQEKVLKKFIARELIIFAIIFSGTRDIILALLVTITVSLVFRFFIDEKSPYCLLSDKLVNLMDENGDGVISEEEQQRAIQILQKAQLQKKENHINI